MATEKYTTLGQTTLSGAYTSGGTTLSCTAVGSFPATGNFRVRVDNEIFKITSVSGTTLTGVGAQEGTSAANHSSGVIVLEVMTAASLDAIRTDISSIGTIASLPATTGQTAGNVYRTTDSPYEFVFDGSIWQAFKGGVPVTVPLSAGWTTLGSSTFDTTYGYAYSTTSTIGSASLNGAYRAVPSTPYTIKVLIDADVSGQPPATNTGNVFAYGIALSDGTKYVSFALYCDGAGPGYWTAKWSNRTTIASTYSLAQTTNFPGSSIIGRQPKYFYVTNNATNLLFGWSIDGNHLKQVESRAIGDYLGTITQFAIVSLAQNVGVELAAYSLTGF